ncbi:Gm766 [Bugula neritina]|uniref:Gm766 n=1 Tax=Bugula neritina TaxID=10212 RepID=A0A7J7K642_BUGNE|nr:Gm766 [Bugula neritina]
MEERQKNILPDSLKDHCLANKYKYVNFDEGSGFWKPFGGDFVISRPHATFNMSTFFNSKVDPFEELETVTMEKGDFLLIAVMKTGTHLLYEIMRMLANGKAAYNTSQPRFINTHLVPSWLPPNFRRSDTKIVATLRNPKDAFVSYFHHHKDDFKPGEQVKAWKDTFNWLLHCKEAGWSNYLAMYADIWDNCKNDPNVLIVYYEHLVLKPEESIRSIAKHMGVAYTSDLIQEVVAACDVEKMRKGKVSLKLNSGKVESELIENYGMFYRKGKIGDWKNWFSVAQNEEFHRVFDEWNKSRQIPFIFE